MARNWNKTYTARAFYGALLFASLLLVAVYSVPGREGSVLAVAFIVVVGGALLPFMIAPVSLMLSAVLLLSGTPAAQLVGGTQAVLTSQQLLAALVLVTSALTVSRVYPIWDEGLSGNTRLPGPVWFCALMPAAWLLAWASFVAGASVLFSLSVFASAAAAHVAHALALDGFFTGETHAPSPSSCEAPIGA